MKFGGGLLRKATWWVARSGIRDFDPSFYASAYPDLRGKSTEGLTRHYAENGRREGRFPNAAEALKRAGQEAGALPGDFDWRLYRLVNPDLRGILDSEWQYKLHYLQSGRREGRPYGSRPAFRSQWSDEGPEPPWGGLFQTASFALCNEDWLSSAPVTRQEAIEIFLTQGIERLAPLASGYRFDPDFYRVTYDRSEADPVVLYRFWLTEGILAGHHPNEEIAIRDFIGERAFPTVFDWTAYRALIPVRERRLLRNRTLALKHLFETGFSQGIADTLIEPAWMDLLALIGAYYAGRSEDKDAVRVLRLARSFGYDSERSRFDLGMALSRQGYVQDALDAFSSVPPVSEFGGRCAIKAAELLMQQGRPEEALALTQTAVAARPHIAAVRSVHWSAIGATFEASRSRALQLYGEGKRTLADTELGAVLDRIEPLLLAGSTPVPLGPPPGHGHVVILANCDLPQCTHYRVEQKRLALESAGIPARICDVRNIGDFAPLLFGARAAIFYRVPAQPEVMRAIQTARALSVPTIYEVDDLILAPEHYPDPYEAFEEQISRRDYEHLLFGVPLFRRALQMCDHAIASTHALADELRRVPGSRRVFVVRNGLDQRNARMLRFGEHPKTRGLGFTIFYGSGTKAHNRDFNTLVGPALLTLLQTHDHTRLVVAGHLSLMPEFETVRDRVTAIPFVSNLDEYWALLASCDVNLAVLAPGVAADCKSEIKWLEAAAVGVPSIVSGTATYRDVIQHDVDGLLATTSGDWANSLNRLLHERPLGRRLGQAARQKALTRYGLEALAEQAAAAIEDSGGASIPDR